MLLINGGVAARRPWGSLATVAAVALGASFMVIATERHWYAAAILLLGGTGAAVVAGAVYSRRVFTTCIALFAVCATVAADFPLTEEHVTGGARPGLVVWLSDITLFALLFLLVASKAVVGGRTRVEGGSRSMRLLACLLSTLLAWEMYSAFGATEFRYAIYQVLRDAIAIAILVSIYFSIRRQTDAEFILRVLLLALVFHVTFALAQIVHGGPFGLSVLGELHEENVDYSLLSRYSGREIRLGPWTVANYFSGLAGAPYRLAALVVLVLPLSFALAATTAHRRAWLGFAFFAVAIVVLSLSRGAWGGMVVALIALAWLQGRRTRDRIGGRRRLRLGGVVVVLGAMLPLIAVVRSRLFETNLSRSASQRLELVRVGLTRLPDPIRGMGPNNFAVAFEGMPSVGLRAQEPIHNVYALYLIETGVVGLALYLATLGVIVVTGIGLARGGGHEVAVYAGAITAGIIGLSAWGMTTWLYRDHVVYTTFWLLCGVLMALKRVDLQDPSGSRFRAGGALRVGRSASRALQQTA